MILVPLPSPLTALPSTAEVAGPPAPLPQRCPPGWSPTHTQGRRLRSPSLFLFLRSTELDWKLIRNSREMALPDAPGTWEKQQASSW